MSAKKLRIGLIGTGGIMRWAHLGPGWTAVENCELYAACDVNAESARKLAEDYKIPHVFTDYREMMKLDGLDAVDICTPNMVHRPAAVAALENGLHVLCEKPLATTVADVQAIAAAAKRSGKLVMTAQHMRYQKESVAVKKWIASGALGEVYHSRVHATRRSGLPGSPTFIDPKLSGGGPCLDIGVHALDAALWLMDFPDPVRVSGRTMVNFAKGYDMPSSWGEWDRQLFGVEDFASGYVTFSNGASMMLEASWLGHQEKEDFSCTIFGKKAGVVWPSAKYYSVLNGVHIDGSLTTVNGMKQPHTEEILAFAKAIRENLPSPIPVEQTIKVIAILEGIVRSSQAQAEVSLAY